MIHRVVAGPCQVCFFSLQQHQLHDRLIEVATPVAIARRTDSAEYRFYQCQDCGHLVQQKLEGGIDGHATVYRFLRSDPRPLWKPRAEFRWWLTALFITGYLTHTLGDPTSSFLFFANLIASIFPAVIYTSLGWVVYKLARRLSALRRKHQPPNPTEG